MSVRSSTPPRSSVSETSTLSRLLEAKDRLEAVTVACEQLLAEDTTASLPLAEIIALARKITPATMAPAGLRYAFDQGPVEALPSRFRLPFPNQDEMRLSLIAKEGNLTASADSILAGPITPPPAQSLPVTFAASTKQASPQVAPVSSQPKIVDEDDDEDYEGEFD